MSASSDAQRNPAANLSTVRCSSPASVRCSALPWSSLIDDRATGWPDEHASNRKHSMDTEQVTNGVTKPEQSVNALRQPPVVDN